MASFCRHLSGGIPGKFGYRSRGLEFYGFYADSIGGMTRGTQFISNYEAFVEKRVDALGEGHVTALIRSRPSQRGDQFEVFVYSVSVTHSLAAHPSVSSPTRVPPYQ
jgi:hypothetical protein